MAIDSVRLLSDSAAQIWRRLNLVRPLEIPADSAAFESWLGADVQPALDHAEEQALRRDYRRLLTLVDEIAFLVRSRPRALELVREQLGER
jgi:hypothetical protein